MIRLATKSIKRMPRPLSISIIVKELKLPVTHWYFWPNQGTRISGNLCHWIDLVMHFSSSIPSKIVMLNSGDTLALSILFKDGTLSNITASDLGDDLRGVEEYIEIRGGDKTISIYDFKKLVIRSGKFKKVIRRLRRNKGHDAMYSSLKQAWLEDKEPQYPDEHIYWVSYIIETASKMLLNDESVHIIHSK